MPSPAENIVAHMMNHDAYSQWLGIKVKSVSPGKSILEMTVRKEMTNGFGIAHGGITYSLSDSALAFASNGYGPMAVSIETSISHTKPVKTDDVLTATAIEKSRSKRIGIYEVEVTNQNQVVVALFKGTVFIRPEEWPQKVQEGLE